jgi:hypothetical protein
VARPDILRRSDPHSTSRHNKANHEPYEASRSRLTARTNAASVQNGSEDMEIKVKDARDTLQGDPGGHRPRTLSLSRQRFVIVCLSVTALLLALAGPVNSTASAASSYELRDCTTGTTWFSVSQILFRGSCYMPAAYRTGGPLATQFRNTTLPNGKEVRGRESDGCSVPGHPEWQDKPWGYDFTHVCWMHDYGYELIRQGILSQQAEPIIDEIFWKTLLYVCNNVPAYHDSAWDRFKCPSIAKSYGYFIRWRAEWTSTAPAGMQTQLPTGTRCLLESRNYPNLFLRPNATASTLSPAADAIAAGGDLRVVSGLAGQGISFESVKYPGRYLRHQNYTLKLHTNDGTDVFRRDATFKPRLRGDFNIPSPLSPRADNVSLESYNMANGYIRHYSGLFEVNTSSFHPNVTTFNKDATFRCVRIR